MPGLDDIGGLVKALQREDWLGEYERGFLASIWEKKVSRGYKLSEKQMAVLKKIRKAAGERREG